MPEKLALDRAAVVAMYRLPSSTVDVARAFGVTAETIRKRLIEWGEPRHPQKNLPRPQPNKARKMEVNGFWRGGQTVDRDGYVLVKRNDHPDANHLGYVRLHRLVMEEKLGRRLSPTEVVHHRDEDPSNNHPDNLVLYESNAAHLAETLRGKCPAWSEEGYQRMRRNGVALAEKQAAIRQGLEAYARMHNESRSRFLKTLCAADRDLLRMAVMLGRFEPLPELRSKRETIQAEWLARQSPRSRRSWDRRLASRG
jgi:hypothetical protein